MSEKVKRINWRPIIGVVVLLIIILVIWQISQFAKPGGLPWSGGSAFSAYEMSNGHLYHLYPINKSIYVYDVDAGQGHYYYPNRGNEGPFVSQIDTPAGPFKWVLQWHGDTISIERVPNYVGRQPDYYLLGTKIPNVYKTRSYQGRYWLTNRKEGGPVVEGQTPPGVLGLIDVQPSGADVWVAGSFISQGALAGSPNGAVLFQKEYDNGFNAQTFTATLTSGQIVKIIFYDDVNIEILVGLLEGGVATIAGTRDPGYLG